MNIDKKRLEKKEDKRGFLIEILKKKDLKRVTFGHLLVTVAKPGQSKGGHYHKKKNEWFLVIKGSGMLSVENIKTKVLKEIPMNEENSLLVKIPPFHAHSIKNVGRGDMFLLAYTDLPFDRSRPDTYPYKNFSML